MPNNSLFLDHNVYTVKNTLLWGLFAEHCKQVKYGELSTGHKCYHIGMAILEFFPVLSQLVSLVELTVKRIFDNFNFASHENRSGFRNNMSDLKHSLRDLKQRNKSEADGMIDRIHPVFNPVENQRLLGFTLPEDREWTYEDLHNGSELQQLFEIMNNRSWNPENFNSLDFVRYFCLGYGPLTTNIDSFINEATNIRQLIAISVYLVCDEALHQEDNEYQELTDIGLTYLAFAQRGTLNTWLQKSQELLSQ